MAEYGRTDPAKASRDLQRHANFIANRFISVAGTFGVNYALEHGYTVGEVDALTGPLIGRPEDRDLPPVRPDRRRHYGARQPQPVRRDPRR